MPTVCGSLRQAVESLAEPTTNSSWPATCSTRTRSRPTSELKWEEIHTFEQAPHPIEFQMYYSA